MNTIREWWGWNRPRILLAVDSVWLVVCDGEGSVGGDCDDDDDDEEEEVDGEGVGRCDGTADVDVGGWEWSVDRITKGSGDGLESAGCGVLRSVMELWGTDDLISKGVRISFGITVTMSSSGGGVERFGGSISFVCLV